MLIAEAVYSDEEEGDALQDEHLPRTLLDEHLPRDEGFGGSVPVMENFLAFPSTSSSTAAAGSSETEAVLKCRLCGSENSDPEIVMFNEQGRWSCELCSVLRCRFCRAEIFDMESTSCTTCGRSHDETQASLETGEETQCGEEGEGDSAGVQVSSLETGEEARCEEEDEGEAGATYHSDSSDSILERRKRASAKPLADYSSDSSEDGDWNEGELPDDIDNLILDEHGRPFVATGRNGNG